MGLTDPFQLSNSLRRHMDPLNQDILRRLGSQRTDVNLPRLRFMTAETGIGMPVAAGYIDLAPAVLAC